MAPLPTTPTMMEKEEEKKKEKKEDDDRKLKEKANPKDGTLVVVEPMKKGGNCGVIGPGLLDVFLRLGFLKVGNCLSLKYIYVQDIISQNLSAIAKTKILGHRIKPKAQSNESCHELDVMAAT